MRLFLSIVVFITFSYAAIHDDLFIDGNDAMIYENYSDAIQIYESILALGYEHPDLYYNLGNAYYRLHYIGLAIWAYHNANELAPRDLDIKHNLSIANARMVDRIDMPESMIFLKFYRDLKSYYTFIEWLIIGSIMILLQVCYYFIFRIGLLDKRINQSFINVIIIITLCTHFIALDKYFQKSNENDGVVIANNVDAYSGPFYGENSVLFKINEGTIADIHKIQDDWVEIILIDGKKGWIPSGSIRRI